MAKLPGIQYRGVSPVLGRSPSTEVAASAQRLQLVNQAQQVAADVTQAYTDYNVAETLADYNKETADFRIAMDQYNTISREEVEMINKEHGTSIEIGDKQYLRKDEWYPQVLEKELTNARRRSLENIRSPEARARVDRRLQEAELGLMEQEYSNASRQAQAYEEKAQQARIASEIDSGNYDAAEMLINTSTLYRGMPELRDAALKEVAIKREVSDFDTLLVTGQFDQVMEMTSDVERETNLSSDKLRQIYFSAQSAQNQAIARARQFRQESYDRNFSDALVKINTGGLSAAQIGDLSGSVSAGQLNTLFSVGRSLASGASSDSGVIPTTMNNDLTRNALLVELGVYDAQTRTEAVERLKRQVIGSIQTMDNNGNIVPGISSSQASTLMSRLNDIGEEEFTSQEYREVVQDLRLRITGTTDMMMVDDVRASQLANALSSLNAYMRNEQDAGKAPDPLQWQSDNRARFLSEAAMAAQMNIPPDIKPYVSEDGGVVDYSASMDNFARRLNNLQAQNPGAVNRFEAKIAEFRQWAIDNNVEGAE